MMDLDITFEDSPLQRTLDGLKTGDTLSALTLLPLVEEEEEDAIMEALEELDRRRITLDIRNLPPVAGSGELALRLQLEQKLVRTDDMKAGLEPNDALRLYLEELEATPCAGEEGILLERLSAGDEQASSELLTLGLSLVVQIAREHAGKGVLLMDLIQEGSLGLWQGIRRYREGDYGAHCRWWIRQYMARAVLMQARSGGLCRKLRQGMEDYRDMDRQLLSELGRNPALEEIAERMHVSPEEALSYRDMIEQARMRQKVDKALGPREESPDDEQAVENTAYFQQRQRILELLSLLPEQDAKLLSLRFGLEGELPLSPEETGRKLGIPAQEVTQREAEALMKLRQQG